MKKRLITILLTYVFLLQSAIAFAEQSVQETDVNVADFSAPPTISAYTDITDADTERIAGLFNALGIIKDIEDGNFEPDLPVTRIEAISAFIKLLGVDANAFKGSLSGVFYDLPKDSEYYNTVSSAVAYKLVSGYDDNTIRLNDNVSADELVTMSATILGYKNYAENFGGYPEGYYKALTTAGLLMKLNVEDALKVTKSEFIKFLYDVAKTDMYVESGRFGTVDNPPTVFEKYQSLYSGKGVVNSTPVSSMGDYKSIKDTINIGGTNYYTIDDSFNVFFGYPVEYWYKDMEDEGLTLVYMSVNPRCESVFIDGEDIISYSNGTIKYFENEKQSTATLSSGTEFVVNGIPKALKNISEVLSQDNLFLKIIDSDMDGIFDVALIDIYSNLWLRSASYKESEISLFYNMNLQSTKIDTKKQTLEFFGADGKKIEYNKVIEGQFDANGNPMTTVDLSAITSDSIVSIFADSYVTQRGYKIPSEDAKYIKVYVSDKKISGTLTQTDDDELTISEGVYKTSDSNFLKETTSKITLGSTGNFYLDVFGDVVLFQQSDDTSGDYVFGYLINAAAETGLDGVFTAKIMQYDGEIKVFTATKNLRLNDVKKSTDEILQSLKQSAGWIRPGFNISQLIQYKTNAEGKLTHIRSVLQSTGLPAGADESHINRDAEPFTIYKPDDSFGIFRNMDLTAGDRAPVRGYYFKPKKYMSVPDVETFVDDDYRVDVYAKDDTAMTRDQLVEQYNVSMFRKAEVLLVYEGAGAANEDIIWTNYSNSWPVMIKEVYTKIDEDGVPVSVALVNTGAVEREYVGETGSVFNGLKPGDVVYLYTKNHNKDIITRYEYINYLGVDLKADAKLPSIDTWSEKSGNAYTAYGEVYAVNGNDIIVQAGPIVDSATGRRETQTTCYLQGTTWQSGGTLVLDYTESKSKPRIANGTITDLRSVYADGPDNASRILYVSHQGAARAMLIYNGMESE
mgnify:CR=1 FL=1